MTKRKQLNKKQTAKNEINSNGSTINLIDYTISDRFNRLSRQFIQAASHTCGFSHNHQCKIWKIIFFETDTDVRIRLLLLGSDRHMIVTILANGYKHTTFIHMRCGIHQTNLRWWIFWHTCRHRTLEKMPMQQLFIYFQSVIRFISFELIVKFVSNNSFFHGQIIHLHRISCCFRLTQNPYGFYYFEIGKFHEWWSFIEWTIEWKCIEQWISTKFACLLSIFARLRSFLTEFQCGIFFFSSP